ncbi:MAG: ATP synthase F0 subunit B [Desulfobulbaceae bacterium]|nr:ATP synthase F0 subunit B [Desulfobulbaceae bacterium]
MITIDITMFIHIVNMIVLMFVLNAILYKPVQSILQKRQEKLDSLNNDVEQFEQNARHRQKEVDKKMREASARAKEALDTARGEAQAVGSEKLAGIRSETDSEKEKNLSDIRAQIDAARKELQEGASDFAKDMAGKILGRSLEA